MSAAGNAAVKTSVLRMLACQLFFIAATAYCFKSLQTHTPNLPHAVETILSESSFCLLLMQEDRVTAILAYALNHVACIPYSVGLITY